MGVDFKDWKMELRKREYSMRCKVIRKRVDFHDDAYEGNSHADLVLLEPYESTELDMFMSAYYADAVPVKNGEGKLTSKIEVPSFVAAPVSMPCMLRLQWPNELHQKPHLMVMTVSIEHLLNTYAQQETIELKIFPFDKAEELNLYSGNVRI